jgi:hypothetical protein
MSETDDTSTTAMVLSSSGSASPEADDSMSSSDSTVPVGNHAASLPLPASAVLSRSVSFGEDEADPVVIVHLGSSGGEHPLSPNSAGLMRSSPLGVALSAKKRRALLVLAVPFLFAIVFRFVHHQELQLPQAVSAKRTFDVNAPPVELPQGVTLESLQQQQQQQAIVSPSSSSGGGGGFSSLLSAAMPPSASRSTSLMIKEEEIPVVIDRGGRIPVGVGQSGKKVKASDALMCRESVINYVINATNGKDECQGLQKAFDEHCSHDDEEEDEENSLHPEENDASPAHEELRTSGGGRRRRNRQRRRLLTRQRQQQAATTQQQQQQKLNNTVEEKNSWNMFFSDPYLSIYLYLKSLQEEAWPPKNLPPKFFAQDAVFDIYPEARQHIIVQDQRRRRLDQDEEDEGALLLATNGTDSEDEEEEETMAPTKPKVASKPHNTLSLPTGKSHVSGKTLEETLFLQQEEQVMHDLKKAVNQTSNATSATLDAKEEAAKSSKAVAETTELVTAVLNNPDAVEARACCASILNVYHENCNIDVEEEISDKRLLLVVLVMACCGMVKSLIRHFKVRWLPEAAGCILVGGTLFRVRSYQVGGALGKSVCLTACSCYACGLQS